ncbi:MAG: hypothetical protein ACI9HE_003258, partial [Planctomycetota bacterium]
RRAKTLVTVATWGLVQRSIAEKGAWLAKLAMCDTLLDAPHGIKRPDSVPSKPDGTTRDLISLLFGPLRTH